MFLLDVSRKTNCYRELDEYRVWANEIMEQAAEMETWNEKREILQQLADPMPRFCERFVPSDFHLFLSCDVRRGGDCVPYIEYDTKNMVTLGLNEELLPKLKEWCRRTCNEHIISDLQDVLS